MKRSKLFLGVTISILAVVAFAAAKTSKFTTARAGYYTNPTNNHCTLFGGKFGWITQINFANQLLTEPTSGARLLYDRDPFNCIRPLYTQNPED